MCPTAPIVTPRRWLRFGIRGILVLMVLVAAPLAWKVNQVRAQRRILATMETSRVQARYDYDVEYFREDSLRPGDPSSPGPLWLHSLLGEDFFADVAEINFSQVQGAHDEIVSLVPALPRVECVSHYELTDPGLEHLARAPSIRKLVIGGSFTRAGFAQLATLGKLEYLVMSSHPNLTDDEMVTTLGTCKTLKHLYIETVTLNDLRRLRESLPGCEVAALNIAEE